MHRIIKPKTLPPKVDEFEGLSEDAKRTIRALRRKYFLQINEILRNDGISNRQIRSRSRSTTGHDDTSDYYSCIYDNTFKKENLTQASPVLFMHDIHLKTLGDKLNYQHDLVAPSSYETPQKKSTVVNVTVLERKTGNEVTKGMGEENDQQLATISTTSPPLEISQDSHAESEEVVYETPLPIVVSESPITSYLETSHVEEQQTSSNLLLSNNDVYFKDLKTGASQRIQASPAIHIEDPLKLINVIEQVCVPSNCVEMAEPVPTTFTTEMKESTLMHEQREETTPQIFHEEAEFDLRLSGISPFESSAPNILDAIESPLQCSVNSVEKDNRNSVESMECPFSDQNIKTKQSTAPLKTSMDDCIKMKEKSVNSRSARDRKRKLQQTSVIDKSEESPLGLIKTLPRAPPPPLRQKSQGESLSKKIKSKFLPPTRVCSSASDSVSLEKTEERLKTGSDKIVPAITDYFCVSQKEQKEAKSLIASSKSLCLTAVYGNGQATVNTFYTAADHAKNKLNVGKSGQSTNCVQSVVVLTPSMKGVELRTNPTTRKTVRHILLSLLSDGGCVKIVVNLKDFLNFVFRNLDCDSSTKISCQETFDPVIASWLLNPDSQPSSFLSVCRTAGISFLSQTKTEWLSCLCRVKAAMDGLERQLKQEKLWGLYRSIEMRLVPLLARMECCSLKVDMKTFIHFSSVIRGKLRKLEDKAYDVVGHKFSINSHPQLRQVLYEELKLDQKISSKCRIGKTNVAQLKSTSEFALNLISDIHPLPSIVLEYRSLQKLVSTYVEGLMTCVVDGHIATHWDQTAAATGRLTSSQPNVQTVPKVPTIIEDYKTNHIVGFEPKTSIELYAREPFISREGWVFLAADFQQVELRILAHLTDDKTLLSLFWKPDKVDVFNLLTSEWHGKPVGSVTSEEREQTKRVVYSVMYGAGKDKLSEYLKVTPEMAKNIMQSFLVRFPCINAFSKKCTAFAEQHGYTQTICGRKRYFPNICNGSPVLKAQAQRQAVNFCIQGSAADICKLAMLAVDFKLSEYPKLKCRLLLQIHDELVWEVSEQQLYPIQELIEGIMENTKTLCSEFCDLQVPLTVSFSYGKSWAHLTPMSGLAKD